MLNLRWYFWFALGAVLGPVLGGITAIIFGHTGLEQMRPWEFRAWALTVLVALYTYPLLVSVLQGITPEGFEEDPLIFHLNLIYGFGIGIISGIAIQPWGELSWAKIIPLGIWTYNIINVFRITFELVQEEV